MTAPLLDVDRVSKTFGGVEALIDVSLCVSAGEKLAVIGPNGAGKTTLFNAIGGELAADRGAIRFDGRSIAGLPPQSIARLGVGRTFQITSTFASMTVRENVQVALLARRGQLWSPFTRVSHRGVDESTALLESAGVASLADRAASTLAYGDLKRVELAIALCASPRLLLMDEPTAGLAPPERHRLMKQVAAAAATNNTAVLFTEHDMDIVFAHADRIVVLSRGRVIAAGIPSVVRANAEVRAVYLGSAADEPIAGHA